MTGEIQEVIEHSVELTEYSKLAFMTVANTARNCYQSGELVNLEKAREFVKMLIHKGHESPLEFASVTFRIVTSRDVTHELVRHRLASYAQESTRYVRYSGGVQLVRPMDIPELNPDGTLNEAFLAWLRGCREAGKAYLEILRLTGRPELARTVLPGSTKTTIIMKMNMREFRHFIKLRTSPAAHPDMRCVAGLCRKRVEEVELGDFLEGI